MQIYHYHPTTGEYLGTDVARVLPGREQYEESDPARYQLPANAAIVAPPFFEGKTIAVWVTGGWIIQADHRGETWWWDHGMPVTITEIGDPTLLGYVEIEPAAPPLTKDQLGAHADAKYLVQMAGGVFIASAGVWVATTDSGRIDMNGAVSLAQVNPAHIFDWVNGAETFQLTAAQVIALGIAVGLWVQQNYTVLGQIRAAIAAETITTTAEIDAAPWPPNEPQQEN